MKNPSKYLNKELDYLSKVLQSESWSATSGTWCQKLEEEFAKKFNTVGFDIDDDRINEIRSAQDKTMEVSNEILKNVLLKNIEQEVFLDAIKLYADLATEISNLELNKKNVEFLKEQFSLTKQQFEIGEVTLTDVSIAEARFSLSESELLKTSKTNLSNKTMSFVSLTLTNEGELIQSTPKRL